MKSRPLALLAFLVLAPLAGVAHASQSAGPGSSAQGALRLAIQIPRLLHMRILEQPRQLEVTAEDLARGFVVARGLVEVLSTHRQGYQVHARLASGPFVEADLRGLERPVRTGGDGARVAMPSMVGQPRPAPYPVEYRLRLAPGTAPGTYAFPVALSVEEP